MTEDLPLLEAESQRARRRRRRAEREAVLQAALARGASLEEAEREVARATWERGRAIARAHRARVDAAQPPSTRRPRREQRDLVAAMDAASRERGSGHGPDGRLLDRFLHPSRAPRRIAWLVYAIAFLDIVSGTIHSWRVRLYDVTTAVPGLLSDAAAAATVVTGLALLLLAHSLGRRKRRAWALATGLTVASILLQLAHGRQLAPVALVLSVVGLVLLVVYRRQFTAQPDPRDRWDALWTVLTLVPLSIALGSAYLAVNDRALVGGWPGSLTVARHVALGLVGIDGGLTFDQARHRTELASYGLNLGLGVLTLLSVAWTFFRSANQPATLSDDDDARIRRLLAEHPDSLGYFATRRDKSVVWSESGKAGICYRVVQGVMLAGGDPVGDPEAWPGAIAAFLAVADEHGWTPAVLGCSERAGRTWVRETGFQVLELGDEAIVETGRFDLEGRSMRNVRQMVGRVRRLGYRTHMFRVRDASEEIRRQAVRDAAAWRGAGTERGFSMATSRVLDPRDPDALVIAATKDGVTHGFLQFAPWGSDGMSLDLMRRSRDAAPGINELLIVEALEQAPRFGIRRVSLNFAMFRSTFERGQKLGAGPLTKFFRGSLVWGNRWFQLESLYTFNAKFEPEWTPRFVVYPRVGDVVRVGFAMGEAEGFLVVPPLQQLFPGRRRAEPAATAREVLAR